MWKFQIFHGGGGHRHCPTNVLLTNHLMTITSITHLAQDCRGWKAKVQWIGCPCWGFNRYLLRPVDISTANFFQYFKDSKCLLYRDYTIDPKKNYPFSAITNPAIASAYRNRTSGMFRKEKKREREREERTMMKPTYIAEEGPFEIWGASVIIQCHHAQGPFGTK